MAQTGFTPIQLYYSTTATTVPSAANLLPGELALNIANNDMSMYTENASGTVKLFFNNPAALKYPTADGTSNQVIKTDGSGNLSFVTLTSGTSILYGNGSGGFSNVTVGSGLTFAGGTLTATAQSSTSVGLVRAIAINCILP